MAKFVPKKIDEREFRSILKQEFEAADSFVNDGMVASQRSQSIGYYLGNKLGNEVKGRSSVVSRDTFETVEWILPQLVELFVGVDSAVEFEPHGSEDIDSAEQATEYVNYLIRKKRGFLILHDWFKDTLLEKKGYVKAYWDYKVQPKTENYENIDNESLEMLAAEDGVKIVSVEEKGNGLFDARVQIMKDLGEFMLECPAPENIVVRPGTTSLETTQYVGEIFYATRSTMLAQGYQLELLDKVRFDESDRITSSNSRLTRHSADGSGDYNSKLGNSHDSMKKAKFVESYIVIDLDGDGFAETLQVIHDADVNVILDISEVDTHPYLELDAIRIPHKYFGLSIGDIMKDIQEIKTVLLRGMLDHTYYTINGRWAVLDGMVNLTDLTNPVPGGVVRESIQGAVRRLDTPGLDPSTFGLLDYVDRIRERRAGVNELQQGVDKEAMGSNVAADALSRAMKAAQQRILMLGRMFAETGVKELMYKIYELARKNQSAPDIVRLRNRFVEVNPRDWAERKDMIVNVGTGNMSPHEKLSQLVVVRDSMSMAAQSGAGIVTPKGAYNLAIEMVKATGRRDFSKFFSDPDDPEAPKPPKPEPTFEEQIKMRELELKKEDLELEKQKLSLEVAKFEWQKVVDVAEVELEDKQKRPVGIQTGK